MEMANHVSTTIEIREGNDEVRKWFGDLVDKMTIPDEERTNYEHFRPVHEMFDTWDATESDPETYGWYIDNIGAKWCHITDAYEESIHFESAWGYPEYLLLRIHKEAHAIDPDVIMSGTYDDEMPNFFGSLVYADGDLWDEEYIGEEAYKNFDLKFYWDEEEEGAEEPEDFDPDYEKMYDIQTQDIEDMISGLKEHREENASD